MKEKKLNPWEVFNIRKKLGDKLKEILMKVVNEEKLSEEEKEFLTYIAKGEKK